MARMKATGPLRFQSLTGIRQVGTRRTGNGTTTYIYVACVHPDVSPVKLTLTVSPDLMLQADAHFDDGLADKLVGPPSLTG